MNNPSSVSSEQELEAAFHDAFEKELTQAVERPPFPAHCRVLDMPCGDGFYTRLLANRLGAQGRIVAADQSKQCLDQTRERCSNASDFATIELVEADVYQSPFGDQSFDAIWCAESFISLEDPVEALRELRRMVRVGGSVVVQENDELHHLLLPWPVKLEAAIQSAVHEYSREKYGRDAKLCPARLLHRQMKEANLDVVGRTTFAADRLAPFDEKTRRFLQLHFGFLKKVVDGRLPAALHQEFEQFVAMDSPRGFIRREDAEFTCLTQLFEARRR
jgi:ubiquinone/menaquinone biosynthesis C-methylase UbiE